MRSLDSFYRAVLKANAVYIRGLKAELADAKADHNIVRLEKELENLNAEKKRIEKSLEAEIGRLEVAKGVADERCAALASEKDEMAARHEQERSVWKEKLGIEQEDWMEKSDNEQDNLDLDLMEGPSQNNGVKEKQAGKARVNWQHLAAVHN
jgi:hypothetical protein